MRKGVLVTGGSRGIGSGIARCMALDGYDVAFTYRGAHKEAQALCRELEGYGARAFCRQANLEKVEDCRETVAWAAQALGQLDAAVCNAGVTLTYPCLLYTSYPKMQGSRALYSPARLKTCSLPP